MSYKIAKYTDIIYLQSQLLTTSNKSYMTLAQRQAIELICRYSAQLAQTAKKLTDDPEQQALVRHDMINILTPIVGYVEMLSDGWIGSLNPDQASHVEIIQQSVDALRECILTYRTQQWNASA
ncbi:MAG: histidine kinase dimerization/phospho-acceptor domain-containing protein [Anaerolineae bacterium]